jgi:hypothetical protein
VNDTISADVARYATAVRAACGDLPGPDRELLLEDLEDHLQEVAAEAGGPLEERLGRPEVYAAELRASAGCRAPASASPAAAGRPDRGCGERGAPSSSGASGRPSRPTRPVAPPSPSCPSCGRPGGCCVATWPCRR